MTEPNKSRYAARRSAQNHYARAEERDQRLRQEIEKERAASTAKSARLRGLRLAKEAADKEAAERTPAPDGEAKAKLSGGVTKRKGG